MTLEWVANKVLETDVLVMGGGIAGCCAAARAAGPAHPCQRRNSDDSVVWRPE